MPFPSSLPPFTLHPIPDFLYLVPDFMTGWFITGTDTGVGKTLVNSALLMALTGAGQRAVGMKPVASGCEAAPNRRQTMADVVLAFDLPVILVADLRLGGLNHALLARAAIEACGLPAGRLGGERHAGAAP